MVDISSATSIRVLMYCTRFLGGLDKKLRWKHKGGWRSCWGRLTYDNAMFLFFIWLYICLFTLFFIYRRIIIQDCIYIYVYLHSSLFICPWSNKRKSRLAEPRSRANALKALGLMGIEGSADSYGLCLLDRMKGRRIEKETDGDRKDCTILVRIIWQHLESIICNPCWKCMCAVTYMTCKSVSSSPGGKHCKEVVECLCDDDSETRAIAASVVWLAVCKGILRYILQCMFMQQ